MSKLQTALTQPKLYLSLPILLKLGIVMQAQE